MPHATPSIAFIAQVYGGARPVVSVTTSELKVTDQQRPAQAPVFEQLDAALMGFDQALRFWLQFVPVPAGSNVAIVDLYSASLGRQGLTLIERRLGFEGPFDFEIHPTNLGHSFIAKEFKMVWSSLH